MTHCFINRAFIQQTFQCPGALIYLSWSQSMELDIALYNLSRGGGGVITSRQLSLQPGTANRKVNNVTATGKIRENPENSKAIFWGNSTVLLIFIFSNHSWQPQIIRVELHIIIFIFLFAKSKALFCTWIHSINVKARVSVCNRSRHLMLNSD